MKLPRFLYRRLAWFNLPGALLVAILQRTPVLRAVALGEASSSSAPIATLIRSAAAVTVALGCMHTLAGATQFSLSANSVSGTTGTGIPAVGFAVTGAPTPTGSYRIANLPPGLSVPGANGGVLNAQSGTISGTPTAGGIYATSITAYEFANAQGSAFGPATITFTISGGTSAPAITAQPVSQTVNVGGTATFSAAASGTPAPVFQWRKNGTNISGATNATLSLTNVQTADAGTYSMVATSSAGSATSMDATLAINSGPAITLQPAGQSAIAGAAASFSVAASGTPAPTIQWRKNGVNLAGATNATLSFGRVQLSDAGTYSAVATNAVGSATSADATLSVGSPPTFAVQPGNVAVDVGGTASFTATVNAAAALQWRKNGMEIAGATNATLVLNNVQASDAGAYALFASNPSGSAVSSGATLTVNVPPSFATQPGSQMVGIGGVASFTASVGGAPTPTLQWRKDGVSLAGATNATFVLPSVKLSDAGAYNLIATNAAGFVLSATATLTVTAGPAIAAQPESQSALAGATVTFAIGVDGTPAPTLQWQKNGTAIAGATNTTLTLANVQPADAATYTVIVTNAVGVATSSPATLTVSAPNPGRIVNLSILTSVTAADPTFTVGLVVGGAGASGVKPLVIRAVGPSLAPLGVGDALPDPDLTVFNGTTPVAANDNWAGGGVATLSAAFAQVGAFAFASSMSRDAAVLFNSTAPSPANYTIQVRGNGATGTVLAELYDATPPGAYTLATPRLINVSVLKQIPAGAVLTAGFVIGGATAKQVLVRAVGPALGTAFGVSGAMADPKIDLFDGSQKIIATNNDWGGGTALATAFTNVGAFALANASSKDAALVIALEPGNYTAQVSGVGGTGGLALVEVYEVP